MVATGDKPLVTDGAEPGKTFRDLWRPRKVREGWIDPEQLLANPDNWRIHPENQQLAMVEALDELGWLDDIKAQEGTDLIFNGHMRCQLAITAGEKVPVSWYDLNDDEVNRALLEFDALAAAAMRDTKKLADLRERAQLDAQSHLNVMLNQQAERDAMMLGQLRKAAEKASRKARALGNPEAPQDVPKTAIVLVGERWVLGQHALLIGDSRVAADVERLLADEKVTLVYTDPPYGVEYEGGHKKREMIEGDDAQGKELDELFLAPFLVANKYRSEKCAVMCWFASGEPRSVIDAADSTGWKIRAQIIWRKNNAQFGAFSAQYHFQHEPLYYFVQEKAPPKWYGGTTEVTIWDARRDASNDFHPTQKPVELAERAIQNHTDEGDIVLDLYGGSGATMIGCEGTRRVCRMMELTPQYAQVIIERWMGFTGEDAVREDGVSYSDLAAEAGRALGEQGTTDEAQGDSAEEEANDDEDR